MSVLGEETGAFLRLNMSLFTTTFFLGAILGRKRVFPLNNTHRNLESFFLVSPVLAGKTVGDANIDAGRCINGWDQSFKHIVYSNYKDLQENISLYFSQKSKEQPTISHNRSISITGQSTHDFSLSLSLFPGESKLFRPRRPRSSSDALSASFNGELLGNMNRCNSYDNLPHDQESDGDEGHLQVPALISPRSAEDVDLSPPEIGVASLDFDPMSFQCSPPKAESECLDSSTSLLESVDYNKDKPSVFKKELDSGSQSHTPYSATSSEPVSPYQEKNPSPFFTLDLSPAEDKPSKLQPFSEKLTCAYSPKLAQKPVRSPPLPASEPVPYALPSRMPDVVTGGVSESGSPLDWTKKNTDHNEASSVSLAQLMASPLKSSASRYGEEPQQELQNAGDTKKAELQEEVEQLALSSGQSKPVPSGLTQPGTVCFPPFFL